MGDSKIKMIYPKSLGKEIDDLIKFANRSLLAGTGIPDSLMPTGEVNSAHSARIQKEAYCLQILGPDVPSERERIEKEYNKIKEEVRCSLVSKLSSVLNLIIQQKAINNE